MTFPVRLGIVPLEIHYLNIAPFPIPPDENVFKCENHATGLEMLPPVFQGGVGIRPRPDH